MAGNIFVKATKLAATALALLRGEVKAPGLFVHKYGISDFKGAAGDTVMVKRPPLLRARDKGWRNNNAITVDNIVQTNIAVPLNQFPVQAVHISPEEATLDEVEYVRDIQSPQVNAMVDYYEEAIIAALAGADFVFQVNFNPNPAGTDYSNDARKVALRARKLFQDAKVPTGGRFWLVGSSVSENIAGHPNLLDVDTSGLPEALREGVVGRLAGFVVIEMDALQEDESYFVHETAIAIANVAPVVPRGAVAGFSVASNGMAITQIFDYDAINAKDRSIVESFVGAVPVLDPEVGPDGLVVLDGDDEPVMDFYRAIKVNFGTPDPNESTTWTLANTGTVSGGTFTLSVDGDATDAIAFDATNPVIAAALNELDGVAGVTVTGTTTKTIKFVEAVVVTADSAAITGGGSKTVTKV